VRLRTRLAVLAAVVGAAGVLAATLLCGTGATSPSDRGCQVDPKTMQARGCSLVIGDTAAIKDPTLLWHDLACVDQSRYRYETRHGDRERTALGARQRNDAYRRLTVDDGDDFYGERCELGENNRDATFQVYQEGQQRITFLSLKLARSLPIGESHWQVVMQMKQVQPADNGGGTPVLSLNVYDRKWRLMQSSSPGPSSYTRQLYAAPAHHGVWTRMAFDITYDDNAGSIRAYIDANGDGDFMDHGERSGAIGTYTLKTETAGTDDDGIIAGAAIPSHLRVGIYHDTQIACPPPGGCALGVDDVQVVSP
jgi:hypothetical protein